MCPDPVDAEAMWEKLNDVGREMAPRSTVMPKHDFVATPDISTGARFERQKDTARPFYQLNAPWAAMKSHAMDYIKRFLRLEPTSMFGVDTRTKQVRLRAAHKDPGASARQIKISDDKKKYSPHMAPEGRQDPMEVFVEMSGQPALRAVTASMNDADLHYRVVAHMVKYPNGGTDKEGLDAPLNTWAEVCGQLRVALVCAERRWMLDKVEFLAFIDDALRTARFDVRGGFPTDAAISAFVEEVELTERAMCREMSWDKTFVSERFHSMLNEHFDDEHCICAGAKAFLAMNEINLKYLVDAGSMEEECFGKAQGCYVAACPSDLCHYYYVYMVVKHHSKMGVRVHNSMFCSPVEYHFCCITPISDGGLGIRGVLAMESTEASGSRAECVGNLNRFAGASGNAEVVRGLTNVISGPFLVPDAASFMRNPRTVMAVGPRIHTQRAESYVRAHLSEVTQSPTFARVVAACRTETGLLQDLYDAFHSGTETDKNEVMDSYKITKTAMLDEYVAKVCSGDDARFIIPKATARRLRKAVRTDLVDTVEAFRIRYMGFASLFVA